MAASSNRNRIRQSWQPSRLEGAPAKAWLIVRRLTASLIAVGLIAWCLFLLVQWVTGERTYFVHLTASTYRPGQGWPVSYVRRDSDAFRKLEQSFAKSDVVDPFAEPLTQELLLTRLNGKPEWNIRGKDTLIVYLTAHGVVQNKTAYLLCETEEGDDDEALLPVSEVLKSLKLVPARTKVLILDAGRGGSHTRLGPVTNTFPNLLDKAIQDGQDPHLWVLSANDSFERSHVSPALHRSILGFVLSSGLKGDADSDGDRQIALDELVQYVRMHVSNCVEQVSSGNESQTPRLLHCNADQLSAAPILLASNAPRLPDVPITERFEGRSQSTWQIWSTIEEATDIAIGDLRDWVVALRGADQQSGSAAEVQAAEAPPSASNEQSGAEVNQVPGEGESPTTNNVVDVQVRLLESWKLLESLTGSALAEGAADRSAPSVFAPRMWRELNDQLLWYEQFCTVEVPDDKKKVWRRVIDEIDGIRRSLRDFAKQPDARPRTQNIVERIRAAAPGTPISVAEAPLTTLALLELIGANDAGRPLPKVLGDLKVFVEQYRVVITNDDSQKKDLDAILEKEKIESLPLSDLYEFQLLNLRADSAVAWETLRLLLLARLRGEQAAANMLCGEGWARKSIEVADRTRSAGERMIFDRTDQNWEVSAKTKFHESLALYDQAIEDLQLVHNTVRQRNKLLAGLPEYIRLFHESPIEVAGDRSRQNHPAELIDLLKRIDSVLVAPSDNGLPRNFSELSKQLQEALNAIDNPEETSENPVRMAGYLATALPTAERRLELKDKLPALDKRSLPQSEDSPKDPPTPIRDITDAKWNEIMEHLETELGLARLTSLDVDKFQIFKDIRSVPESERWGKLNELSDQLAQLDDTLPESLKAIAHESSLTDDAKRPDRLAKFRRATQSWLLLGPQTPDNPEDNISLSTRLDRAAWYDLLRWHSNRYYRAAIDVPRPQHGYMTDLAKELESLAGTIPNQPKILPMAPPQVTLAVESIDSLDDEKKTTQVYVTVKSHSPADNPVWLFAQFDKNLLNVDGIYPQNKLEQVENEANSAAVAVRDVNYATLLQRRGIVPTANIPAHGSKDFTLNLERLENAEGATKLILKAVSGTSFVRYDAEVRLPGRDELQLTVDIGKDFWHDTNQGIRLLPLPGHEQSFPLRLANRTKVEKKVKVTFYNPVLPETDGTFTLPDGAINRDEADRQLARFRATKLGPDFSVVVPDTGKAVPLQVPEPNPANLPSPAPPSSDGTTPKILLDHGLLVRLEDEAGLVTIRHIQITPQRPHRYLTATPKYNAATRELEVVVEASNTNIVPAKGFKFELKTPGISRQTRPILIAELKPPDANSPDNPATAYTARMYARLVANQQEIKASVDVDGYPRAFLFHLSGGEWRDDANEVRVASPKQQSPYQAPRDTVPVDVEVDAPRGSFDYEDQTSFVEIGLDADRKGRLDESIRRIKRYSDRQVTIEAKSISPDGTLTLNTSVDDFRNLQVPATGLTGAVYVLARLHTGTSDEDKWSNPVEIRLDDEPPMFIVELNPGQPSDEVELGKDLDVLVYEDADNADLSGIKKVEAAFDLEATAEKKEEDWVVAKREERGWLAKLPTKDLSSRRYTVLIRATDVVDNQGELEREVEVFKKRPVQAARAVRPNPANDVSGVVKYGVAGVPDAKVWLIAEGGVRSGPVMTDQRGQFRFPKVKPGEYKVRAEGSAAAVIKWGEQQIAVVPRPQPQPSVDIELTWKVAR